MARVRLIHWNAAEGRAHAKTLRAFGHVVPFKVPAHGGDLKQYGAKPPDAFVIVLDRLPSHGREVGCALRSQKSTRHTPLVFVGGPSEKVAKVKALLPDATFSSWRGLKGALARALRQPPEAPVVPGSLSGYSGTPLPKKLGIKAETRLMLLGAPADFETTLGSLPDGVAIKRRAGSTADVALLFSTRRADLQKRLPAALRAVADGGRLWLAWPKKTSGVPTELAENDIRQLGLATGMVDFKICAIDATWSGLCFGHRRG